MEPTQPRLSPIEHPKGLRMRLVYWFSKWQYGKVLTPIKVLYARKPKLAMLAFKMGRIFEKDLTLDPVIRFLVQAQVSRMNGCTFCQDIGLAHALRQRIGVDRFEALEDFPTSDAFSERERAALAFAEEATRTHSMSDETWENLHAHFNEVEIVELVWVNAVENYFNLHAAVMGIGSDHLAPSSGRKAAMTRA